MKRRPYRLKFRPVRRPLELKLNFDFNLKPSFTGLFLSAPAHYPPALVALLEHRQISAADVARLAEALKPVGVAMRSMAAAMAAASLLPAGYLERLRVAMNKEAQEQKLEQAAWLDEASRISQKQYADLLLRSARMVNPAPHIFISPGY